MEFDKGREGVRFTFYIQGSSSEPYRIEYDSETDTMSCSCQAGLKKQICKHRLGLLQGNAENLLPEVGDSLNTFLKNLQGSRLFLEFIEYKKLESASALLDQRLKEAKSKLLKIMKG